MARLQIHLLGGFLIQHEGRNLPPIPSAAARSLFAYLITHRDRRHTRDLLAGTFWPDMLETAARRRLSQTLWQIQTAFQGVDPDDVPLKITPSDIGFDDVADYWLDVAAFDEHVAAAAEDADVPERTEIIELEAAVDLYRGEFLAGFYDDWALLEQDRLRGQYLTAVSRLVALHKGRADYETALSFARQLALNDPVREDAHREVMRLCFLLGRSNEALQHYERCVAVLEEELGAEPSFETRELRDHIAQLRDKGDQPFAPTVEAPLLGARDRIPLVGRDEERVAVLRHLEDTLLGNGGVVLVEADAGVGKTRFLQELTEDAQWRGLTTLGSECGEEEQLHPYQAVRKILDGGLTRLRTQQLAELLDGAALADLALLVPRIREWLTDVPAPRPLRSAAARDRMNGTLRRTFAALAELSPHAIFVDDAQWIDEESIAVLAELGAGLRDNALQLVLSYRPSEARERQTLWSNIVNIDASSPAERIELSPLDLQASTQLIQESLAPTTVDTEVTEGLFLETGGNPLFILETLRTWHEDTRDGATPASDPATSGRQFPMAGGVVQVIARRFADLDEKDRGVLEAAAVTGRFTDPALLAAICEVPRMDALRATEELLRRGILVEGSDGYDFSHHQMRTVILDGLEDSRRADLHGAVATTLQERRPDAVEELAYHFSAARIPNEASRYSTEAGRRATDLAAYETAARHFANAAAWDLPDGRYELLSDWEDTLDLLGRRSEQHVVLDEMDQLADSPLTHAETTRRRSRLLDLEGNHREAVALAEQAVAEVADCDEHDMGRSLQTLGLVLSHSGAPLDAVPHLEAAVATYKGYPAEEASALCDLGNALCDAQQYDRAAEMLTRAMETYEELDDPYGIAETSGQLAIVHMERGDHEMAVPLYERALALARDLGYRRGEAINLANLGSSRYFQGSIADALELYDQAAVVFAAIGDRRGAAIIRVNTASVRFAILGDDTGEPVIRDALEFFSDEGHDTGAAFCHEHLAAIAHRSGRLGEARGHVETGLGLVSEGGHRWVQVHLRRLGARVELDAGSLSTARSHIDEAQVICAELDLNDVAPSVESLAALIALESDEPELALDLARDATAMLEKGADEAHIVWYRRYLAERTAGTEDEANDALNHASRMLHALTDALPPEIRESARTRVPDHRAIVAAAERTFSTERTVTLPRVEVPLGRPVHDDEWIEVVWTITDPSDASISNRGERRRMRLQRLAEQAERQGGAPRVEDLAETLGVSEATVRRDLAALRKAGIDVSTRGSRS